MKVTNAMTIGCVNCMAWQYRVHKMLDPAFDALPRQAPFLDVELPTQSCNILGQVFASLPLEECCRVLNLPRILVLIHHLEERVVGVHRVFRRCVDRQLFLVCTRSAECDVVEHPYVMLLRVDMFDVPPSRIGGNVANHGWELSECERQLSHARSSIGWLLISSFHHLNIIFELERTCTL